MYFEVGTPSRRFVVSSELEMVKILNTYNGKLDILRSVYGFGSLRNVSGRLEVDPETIIVDRLFFDLDVPDLDQIRPFFSGKMKEIRKVVNFTGRGFHVILKIRNNLASPKVAIGSAQVKIAEKMGVDLMIEDNRSTIGNIRQLFRVPNTWHIKRGSYCIPVIEEDLDGTYEDMLDKAKSQRLVPMKMRVFGSKTLDISKYDKRGYYKKINGFVDKLKIDVDSLKKSEDFLKNMSIPSSMICDRVKLLLRPDANFSQREEVIIYCRDKLKLKAEETALFLYNILSSRKWIHCVDLGDIERLYMRVRDSDGERYRYSYKKFCDKCYNDNCRMRYI